MLDDAPDDRRASPTSRCEHRRVELSDAARARIAAARALTEDMLAGDQRVYGLTTGVGALKRVRVGADEQLGFNSLMLRAHRTGTGKDAPEAAVRAAMVAQLAGFAHGWSGVGVELAEHLVAALNAGFAPRVRTIGSLGQSDLGPLADLACGLVGEDEHADELARARARAVAAALEGGARLHQLERVHARLDRARAAPRRRRCSTASTRPPR